MDSFPLHLSFTDLAIRFGCVFVASAILGFDRGEHGHTVGLRTTILVGLAACISMVQANALLATLGKTPESFTQMDVMRLPLGILSGIGFIGGGAILRRGSMVAGVTTAAALWFVTVIGLCFGGGQLTIGWMGAVIGFATLTGLRSFDRKIPRELFGIFSVHLSAEGPSCDAIHDQILREKMTVESFKVTEMPVVRQREYEWRISWKASSSGRAQTPNFVGAVTRMHGIQLVKWDPQSG